MNKVDITKISHEKSGHYKCFYWKINTLQTFLMEKKGHYKLSNEESGHYKLSDEKSRH